MEVCRQRALCSLLPKLAFQMHESKTAIVHIGLPNAGTTLIQRFPRKSTNRLAAASIKYPEFLNRYSHLELAAYPVGKDHVHLAAGNIGVRSLDERLSWKSKFRDRFVAAQFEPERWLFSSEFMAAPLLDADRVSEPRRLLTDVSDIAIGARLWDGVATVTAEVRSCEDQKVG